MGAGAWGTALAKVLADAGNNITLWARRPEIADEINDTQRNTGYLGDTELPKSIRATSDPVEALASACTVLLAVPSPTNSRRPPSSRAATPAGRWRYSARWRRGTSGRTPTRTSSAPRSAVRARTSSRRPAEWPRVSGWARIPLRGSPP